MRQTMHQQPDIYARLQDTALSDYFRNAGDKRRHVARHQQYSPVRGSPEQ